MSTLVKWEKGHNHDLVKQYEIYKSASAGTLWDTVNKVATYQPNVLQHRDDSIVMGSGGAWFGVRTITISGSYLDGKPMYVKRPQIYSPGSDVVAQGDSNYGLMQFGGIELEKHYATIEARFRQLAGANNNGFQMVFSSKQTGFKAMINGEVYFVGITPIKYTNNAPANGTFPQYVDHLNNSVYESLGLGRIVKIDGVRYQMGLVSESDRHLLLGGGLWSSFPSDSGENEGLPFQPIIAEAGRLMWVRSTSVYAYCHFGGSATISVKPQYVYTWAKPSDNTPSVYHFFPFFKVLP